MSGSPPLADAAARLRRTAVCGAVVLAVVALHPARPGGAVAAGSPTAAVPAPASRSQTRLSRAVPLRTGQPVRFEENRGQADPRVRYISRARDYTVALTDDEALLLVRKPGSPAGRGRLQASDMALLRMRLAGGVRASRIRASEAMPGQVYVADAAARGPLTPIDTFARVEYSEVYPGIDLVYYGKDDRLEFDFVVAPFADPDRIGLSLEGAERLTVTDDGDLSMRVGGAEVTLEKPLVYQERDGLRTSIPGAYVLPAGDTSVVRFRLGRYDPSLPLVIDPAWMTVFGSTNEDWLSGFAVDSAGQPRVLGSTFDPATFPHTHHETGVLPPPACFLTKLDAATGLTTYTVLFTDTQNCGTLALSPAGIAYFTGFVYPNGFQNNQGTTVTAVDDSSGVPAISRFGVANYDSSAIGEGVDALAVNGLGHVFLLGACRTVGPGDQPLELSGFNETPDAAAGVFDEGCSLPRPGFTERTQPLLTVVDTSGTFLYGSFLSPGELVGEYGLDADDTGRAFIVGAASSVVTPTADAFRAVCPTVARGAPLCGYLMVLDTTSAGPGSLVYASYLWNTENAGTVIVRLGPTGEVYVASEGRVFDDFPGNRPTNPSAWPYSLFPALSEGIQLARFNVDAAGIPSHYDFGMVFDPALGVAALAGHTARDELADLRLFPSGAPAIATIAHTQSLAPIGIVTTFAADAERVGEVWTHNLGTRTPLGFGVGTGPGGHLLVAGQIDRTGAQDSDIFVEQIEAVDPGTNRPPTVTILEALSAHGNPLTLYAESPTGGALLQLNAIANDPDGDALTYAWSGPFIDSPVTTDFFIVSRLAVGLGQTVTVTVDDGHGNVVSVSQVFNVVGTPFAGTSATPVDSTINGLVFNYAPLTITAAGIDAAGNAYLRSRLDQNPPIPPHLQAGSPPIYFDVSTDATLVFPVAVCLDTRGMSFANPANVRLYQYQQAGGAWVDITAPGSPQGSQLCGQSDSLGTFAIFYPQVPSTAVQTIAGNGVREGANDGPGGNPLDDFVDGPATSTALNYLFGGAYDRARNQLYVSTFRDILRLDLDTNVITRVAGNDVGLVGSIDGPGGDLRDDLVEGGDAFNTYVGAPAELVVSPTGDVVFFDRNTCRIRRLDVAQGRLFAVAGNGTCGSSGDGGPAHLGSVSYGQMVFDASGHLFLAEYSNNARVRRIDALTNVIDTVAGDGTTGTPTNGAPALSTIGLPQGIAFDMQGHLLIAGFPYLFRITPGADGLVDGDADEVISVVGGCNTNCQVPFNGDTLPISHPQVYLPTMGHLTVARDGSVIFPDSFRIRRITPGADGVVTGAGDEIISTVAGYYDWTKIGQIPDFNGDTFATQSLLGGSLVAVEDNQGRIVVVDGNNFRVRRFGLPPAGPSPVSIQTPGLPGAVEGGAYSAAITGAGGTDSGYTWSIDAGALPGGLVLAPSGTPGTAISGIPTAAGTFDFTIRVTDSGGGTATRSFTIVVDDRVTIQTAAVPDALEGNAYTATLTAAGGTGLGYAWSISAGALPAGLALSATGTPGTTISGTPTEDGTFAFTVEVIDSGGNRATRGLTLVVVSSVVEITVIENILVTDAVALLPSAVIGVTEQIVVHDAPVLLPSAMIGVVEDIRVSDQPAIAADSIAPVLTLPAPIVAEAQTPGGAVVTFSVSATDDRPGAVSVLCTPASGTLFAFNGSSPTATTVTCTATDASGNVASGTFAVTVQDTTAPQVLSAQLTVAATEPAGARGNVPQAPHTPLLQQIPLLAGALDAADPSPARVSVQWVACGNPAQVLGPVADTTLYPVGVNCFAYVFRDASGNVGSATGTIEVAPPVGGPILAANVPVQATDLNNVPLPVTATFLALDQPGLLTAVVPQFIPPPPTGQIFVGAPLELHSTALTQAPAVVCMRPPSGDVGERLLALEFLQWVDVTDTSSPAGEICSRPVQPGTFALVRRDMSGVTLSMSPPTGTRLVGLDHQVLLAASDSSDPSTRLVISSRFAGSVELRHPQVPSSPLSVTIEDDAQGHPAVVTVSLGTGAGGELTSTVQHVADLINAQAWPQLIASGWPEWPTDGILAPAPRMRFVPIRVTTAPDSGTTHCYITLPGACAALVPSPSTPYTAAITAYLDLNDNEVSEAGELTAHAEVTWVDTTPPRVHVPTDITVPAAAAAGATVTFTVQAFDNVDGEVATSCSPASGTTFPVGTTTVTCTATDSSGNVGTASFTVTVTPPPASTVNLYLPAGITVAATSAAGAVVNFTVEAYASAFGGSVQVPVSCSWPSGATFPIGTTTVTCTATNPLTPPGLPNVPATGSFTVTVLPYVPPSVQLVATATYTKDGAGRWIATITIRNAGNATANGVQVTTARLNSASGVPLPLSFGSIAPNAVASGQVVFPATAGTSGPANVLRLTLAWAGGTASLSQRALLP